MIHFTLKSAKQPNYEMAYNVLQKSISEEYGRHSYILRGSDLRSDERQRFKDIIKGNADKDDYATALAFLSRCLKKYHNSNVVILIDEYDVPLENAYFKGFDFVRSLLESALKTNDALEFAAITGCLRISRESIFTGLNNLEVISILSQGYAEYFGFMQMEVKKLLQYYEVEEREQELKEWYDGYQFGETEVYNPWSVLNYVKEAAVYAQRFPKPYWANTSSNNIIRELIETSDSAVRAEIEQLIDGRTIEKPIYEDITYEDIHSSGDNLWNFLFFTGYLKKVGENFKSDQIYLKMAIPNKEVRGIYRRTFMLWFDEKIKKENWSELHQALFDKNCSVIEMKIKSILTKSICFHDEAEQFYHGFMVGILSRLDGYDLFSNREAGEGRPDILMLPYDEQGIVFIFEFKKADAFSYTEVLCEAALEQIKKRQYDAECRENGYKKFIKYGICFCRKSCRVKAVSEFE